MEQGHAVVAVRCEELAHFFFSTMERKVILVTGGSSGIGLATCRYLQQKGCTVYGTSRKAQHGELMHNVPMLQLSLDDSNSIREAIDWLVHKEGRIDVLVNNAGTGIAGAIEDTTTEEIAAIFQTNVFGQLECCRAAIPYMRKQNKGQIINISSIGGEFGLPYRGVYSASKAAIDRFSETMRMELAQWNIAVSIVQPGDYKTNINNNRIIAKRSLEESSPYYDGFTRHYKGISNDISNGHPPVDVAKVVWKIVDSKYPLMRYPSATFWQRFSLSLNRVLPSHLFQKLLVKRFPVK